MECKAAVKNLLTRKLPKEDEFPGPPSLFFKEQGIELHANFKEGSDTRVKSDVINILYNITHRRWDDGYDMIKLHTIVPKYKS